MTKIQCSHCKQEYPQSALKKVVLKSSKMIATYPLNLQNSTSKNVSERLESTPLPDSEETLYFCCSGCEIAYELLKDNNLESFYTKLGNIKLKTKKIQDSRTNINYDSTHFKEKYLKDKDGFKQVYFVLDGAMCAACVWLNEQILRNTQGIKDVSINYTTFKAKILFDESKTSLKNIVKRIQSIGYDAIIYDPQDKDTSHTARNKIYYIKLVVAIFCTMNIMWVNVGQYAGAFSGIDAISSDILNLASFILATPVLFFCASGFYKNAFYGLKNGTVGMDMLVITGSTLVYLYSIFAWLTPNEYTDGHTYFESVCMIILFVSSAKFLESISRKKISDNLLRLNNILPMQAHLITDELQDFDRSNELKNDTPAQSQTKSISVLDIKIGDRLLVMPGEILACDGILESAQASFDYSNISGESMPKSIKSEEKVSSGAIVLDATIIYKVSETFKNSSMSKLAGLLKDAEFSTPPIATAAFRISSIFSKIVLTIAAFGFLYHYFVRGSSFEYALLIAISVIIIACPCALALATPIASVVGLNIAFKNGVIFTQAKFLESLAKANVIIFDKTGTLTQGKMKIVAVDSLMDETQNIFKSHGCNKQKNIESRQVDSKNQELKNIDFKSIESKRESSLKNTTRFYIAMRGDFLESNKQNLIIRAMQKNPHIIAKAVLEHTDFMSQKFEDSKSQESFELIQGRGFRAIIDGVEIIGGSEILMNEILQDSTNLMEAGSSDKAFTLTHIFYLQDVTKQGAKELINTLKRSKKHVILLSGDREEVVENLAKELDINEFYANKTPLQKAEFVKKASQKIAVMIGDGLNDSLALKYAQVGIAMSSGSEISISHSDVIILDSRLETLQNGFKIANLTLKRIKQNLALSLTYNALAIPFALSGYVVPLFAAAFMSLSSICVVLNSLRIYRGLKSGEKK